jgi:hypothetical protein
MGWDTGGFTPPPKMNIPTPQDNSQEIMQMMQQQQMQQNQMWQQRMNELRMEEEQRMALDQSVLEHEQFQQESMLTQIAAAEAESQTEALGSLVEPVPTGQEELMIDFYGAILDGQGEDDYEDDSDAIPE